LKTGGFDVAIIDLGLPGMPDDMLAGHLKEKDPSLVTVLMTGWDIGEEDPKVAGFDLWIRKPFDNLDHVRETIERALDLHEKHAADLAVESNPPNSAQISCSASNYSKNPITSEKENIRMICIDRESHKVTGRQFGPGVLIPRGHVAQKSFRKCLNKTRLC
jgi:DNA-binding response OmpR family regulator